jgi:hypothetical protein
MTAISTMVTTYHIYIFLEDIDENVIDKSNNRSKDLKHLKSGAGRPISMLVNGETYQQPLGNQSPTRQ